MFNIGKILVTTDFSLPPASLLHPLTLRFRDPDLELAYQAQTLAGVTRRMRWALAVIAVLIGVDLLRAQLAGGATLGNELLMLGTALVGALAGYAIEAQARLQFFRSYDSLALHQALIAASSDAVITVDAEGRVVEFNPAAETIFGRTRAAALGQRIGELIVPPAHRAAHTAGFTRYIASPQPNLALDRAELEAMRADGSLFPAEVTLRGVRLAGRKLVTAFIRDLSRARQLEQEMEVQRKALEQHQKLSALGAMLGGLAHELNNPLSIVSGQAQLLHELSSDPKTAQRADKIARAAKRCTRIVATFQAMARQQPAQRSQVDLNQLVREVTELLVTPQVTLQLTLDPHLPPVFGDEDQLHQVLSNLVLNAQQAMDGQATRLLRIDSDWDEQTITVRVRDSGHGVPADLRERIFEPFFTTKPVGQGTGLGLSVCAAMLEAHGGRLQLEDVGAGACFALVLPRPAQTAAAPQARPAARGGVLVVDEEDAVAQQVVALLREAGYQAASASDGARALEQMAATLPALVICDLRMPMPDGDAFYVAAITRWPALAGRFVFMSGDYQAEEGEFDDTRRLLDKPIQPAALLAMVQPLLEPRHD
ncbi:hybrid sensor histidine kinase/response regulator [Massilia sp. TS11]|uniref:hybrid sensor histidine kinase/response regulator n=1 Tax=Massilia sp. TS11 TaxID=2908003 RepID=UPI001EDAFD6F|nr:hybrid sensor histidine kinase/response regulator [Massilia sp. TS11]MCG2586034.1 ATP-binding protein [Massilia sp. TS11]